MATDGNRQLRCRHGKKRRILKTDSARFRPAGIHGINPGGLAVPCGAVINGLAIRREAGLVNGAAIESQFLIGG